MTLRMGTRGLLAGGALALALLAGKFVACNDSQGAATQQPCVCASETASPPIDPQVMAFLSLARALHHEADIKEQDDDLRGAIAALERLVASPPPRRGSIPEVEEVLADAYARLAEMKVRARDVEGARHDVEAGLTHAVEATYFRGHLLEVEGLILEARAAELVDAGRGAEAAQAKAEAIAKLEEAVSVQEQVIKRTLGDGNGAAAEGGAK